MNTTIETSELNKSILELSKEELLKKYVQLKKICAMNQQQTENKKQQLYVAQKEISRRKLLYGDQIAELECLQASHLQTVNKLKEQRKTLENELESINELHHMQYDELDKEYNEKMVILEKLEEDMRLAEEEFKSEDSEDSLILFETNITLKQQVNSLEQQLKHLQDEMAVHIDKKQQLNDKLKATKEETEIYGEKCNYNKAAVAESKSLLETLEGDLAMLKMEHQGLGNNCTVAGPNSLFNEVDERRNLLQDQFSMMKGTYLEKKNERNSLCRKVRVLHMENIRLKYSWEEHRSRKDTDALVIKNSYENAIRAHEEVAKELGCVIDERNTLGSIVISPKESQLFFDVYSKYDNKIRELETLLSSEKHTNFNFNYDLTKCKKNIVGIKEKVHDIERKNAELKAEIEAAERIELGSDPVCVCTLKGQKEICLKKSNECKENQKP